MEDVKALVRSELDDELGRTMGTVYLVATMCGLRMGEICALRWESIDFPAQVVRAERSYADGRLTRPKSKNSERAVPVPTRVTQALACYSTETLYPGDENARS